MTTARVARGSAPAGPCVRPLRADTSPAASAGEARSILSPPSATTQRGGNRRRRWSWSTVRVTVAVLAAGLVVLAGGALAVSAAAPGSGAAAAQPPLPPLPTPDLCLPGSPLPICQQPPAPTTVPGTQLPLPTGVPTLPPCDPAAPLQPCQPTSPPTTPCTGEGCIPQPPTPGPPTGPTPGQPGQAGDGEADCGITDIGGCITNAINAFFRGIVTAALNPLLDLLSNTLLTTPMPDSLPGIGALWTNSWHILLACYSLLILIAGVLVMSYQSLQTRHSIKEVAPRVIAGFLAGALSLWVATKAVQIANGLAQAVMGDGVDASTAGDTLKNMILGSLSGGIWLIFIGIFLAGLLVVLLVTYIVRVALTVILIAGAPIALMFHALPQTEGIAYWWWKALGGCLAIQVAQSLALITAIRVFLAPGGFIVVGPVSSPTGSGVVNLLVALALLYILFKIPFWVLGSLRTGRGRSLVGSLVRGLIAYKIFGLFAHRAGRGGGSGRRPPPSGGGRGGSGDTAVDPYTRPRTTADGQYLLPLPGVRRTRPTGTPRPTPPDPKRRGKQGRQLALPLGDDWPENRPVLGRNGQYRLPLDVPRATPTPSPAGRSGPGTGRPRRPGGQQLQLPFDPYQGNRPTRSGQYPLPLDGVRRTPRPPIPPPAAAAPAPRVRGRQMRLPFDPYQGNRATRSGQYPLPLDGVRRVPPAKPAPPPPARPGPPAGQQLRLPLDLPKPKPIRRPPRPSASPKSGGRK